MPFVLQYLRCPCVHRRGLLEGGGQFLVNVLARPGGCEQPGDPLVAGSRFASQEVGQVGPDDLGYLKKIFVHDPSQVSRVKRRCR